MKKNLIDLEKVEEYVKYIEYIAEGLRFATKETGYEWPKDAIIITKTYSFLSKFDEMLGMKVYTVDVLGPFEWFVATPYDNGKGYKLQKALMEYLDIYPEPEEVRFKDEK